MPFDFLRRLFAGRPPATPTAPAKFPYPIETVHGTQALAAYERLKTKPGVSPIIMGGDDALHTALTQRGIARKKNVTIESVLRTAQTLTFPEALRAEHAKEEQRLRAKYPNESPFEDGFEIGDWPAEPVAGMNALGAGTDIIKRTPLERVHIALIPTTDRTEIPAYLHWGGWNACPAPEHHIAAARAWKTRYGAELVALTRDVAEYRITRRPSSREEAMTLAREHHDYCSEIQDLSEQAAELMVSDWWYFWWD